MLAVTCTVSLLPQSSPRSSLGQQHWLHLCQYVSEGVQIQPFVLGQLAVRSPDACKSFAGQEVRRLRRTRELSFADSLKVPMPHRASACGSGGQTGERTKRQSRSTRCIGAPYVHDQLVAGAVAAESRCDKQATG